MRTGRSTNKKGSCQKACHTKDRNPKEDHDDKADWQKTYNNKKYGCKQLVNKGFAQPKRKNQKGNQTTGATAQDQPAKCVETPAKPYDYQSGNQLKEKNH